MAPKKTTKKIQYYTILFEKYIEVMQEVNKFLYIISDKIKELTEKMSIPDWPDTSLSDLMETFCYVNSYKFFLEDKINNPTEQEIEYTTKNNIKDVLFSEDELKTMQNFYLEMLARKHLLQQAYGYSLEIN